MNKTITITLNKIIFHIEESAYEKLKEYLDAVRARLGADADQDEVMNDIEASIAEKFSARLSAGKQVITDEDVSELIRVMGTVEDFDQELAPEEKATAGSKTGREDNKTGEKTVKKLYRNPDDVIVAGVCSGIAAYFGIDPVLVRLIFFASIFFGGTGLILYFILWFIIPMAETGAQKLEMRGDPVTLAGIEQAVKNNVEKIKKAKDDESVKSGLRKLVELPFKLIKLFFSVLGKIVGAVLPVIRILSGLAFVFFPLMGIMSTAFFGYIFAFRLNHPYIVSDIPVTDLSHDPTYQLGVLAAALVIIIPLVVFLLLGFSLLRKKSAFSLLSAGALLGLWMAAAVTAGAAGFDLAPRIQEKVNEARQKETVTKNFDLKDFTAITANGNYRLELKKGGNYSITAQGLAKDIERMRLKVADRRLEASQNYHRKGICFFCLHSEPIDLTVTLPNLDSYQGRDEVLLKTQGFGGDELKISLDDAARAEVEADFKKLIIAESGVASLAYTGTTTALEADLSDAARLKYSGQAGESIKITESGVASAELKGQAEKLSASLDDSARLKAFSFFVKDAVLNQKGSASAEINSSREITAKLHDAARLRYTGQAQTQIEKLDPSAQAEKVDKITDTGDKEY